MGHQGQTEEPRTNRVTRPWGGWTPSHGFWAGVAAAGVFSLIMVGAAVAQLGDDAAGESAGGGLNAGAVNGSPALGGDVARDGLAGGGSAGAASNADAAASPGGEQPATVSATSAAPSAVASSWSATPVFEPPAPAPALTEAAVALAGDTEARWGIDIVLEGQDWGAGEAEQVANIGAVASAFEAVPVTVTSSVVSGPHGTLAVLSNREGRTIDGWKPYPGEARSFYANSDYGPEGYRAANQIILATGASETTVAHELVHGWTFRDVAPDEYVLALLGDEMRSFMAAAGWEQL
ncbi:MAG TPA: hypothetical protein VFO59_06380, partial [Dehalococcoidia bacterium]|nr:hypothetical protein [Dehalococcoidia bacterium]